MSRLFTYRILDVTLRLRVDDASLVPVAACLHSCSCAGTEACGPETAADLVWGRNSAGEIQLSIVGQSGAETVTEAILFFLSEHRLTQLFAERLGHLLQIHAATVVDPKGNGWLISGPSRAGKTSLTLAFILSGWRWLSDEYALFHESDPQIIRGFPRNFNLKESSFPIYPETAGRPHSVEYFSTGRGVRVRFLDPLDLAPGSWLAQAPWKGLILPRWEAGLAAPLVNEISGVVVAQVLLGEIANWTPWALGVITRTCQDLPVFEFRYSNPRDIGGLQASLNRISG